MLVTRKRVVVSLTSSRYKLLEPLILYLKAEFEIYIFFIDLSCPKYMRDKLNDLGINFVDVTPCQMSLFEHLFKILEKNDHSSLLQYIAEKIYFLRMTRVYKLLYQKLKVYNFDINIGYGSMDLISVVFNTVIHDLGIYTLVPYFMVQPGLDNKIDTKDLNDLRLRITKNSSFYTKITYKKFNIDRFFQQQNNGQFYYAPALMNAMFKFGILPKAPFILGGYSTKSNIICQNTVLGKEAIMKRGIDENQIYILGDVQADKLFEQKRKKLLREGTTKKIVLCLLQFEENGYMSKEQAREEHNRLIKLLSDIENTELLLSLHPIMKYEEYKYLENLFHCKIIEQDLSELIPAADLFINSFSNTLLWSVMCSVPAINCDFYSWKWDDTVLQYENICTITKHEELRNLTIKLLSQKASFENDHNKMHLEEIFNGQVMDSYKETIESLHKARPIKKIYLKKRSLFHYVDSVITMYQKYQFMRIIRAIKNAKKYYIAPYSNQTIELYNQIQQNIPMAHFCGYITTNETTDFLVNVKEIDQRAIVVIGPTRHKKEFYEQIKSKNTYVLNCYTFINT